MHLKTNSCKFLSLLCQKGWRVFSGSKENIRFTRQTNTKTVGQKRIQWRHQQRRLELSQEVQWLIQESRNPFLSTGLRLWSKDKISFSCIHFPVKKKHTGLHHTCQSSFLFVCFVLFCFVFVKSMGKRWVTSIPKLEMSPVIDLLCLHQTGEFCCTFHRRLQRS